ncbi:MAG: rhodanese-like domain-containing protein [Actinomycetota bacterium]
MTETITAAELRRHLADRSELAILDAREQGVFHRGHLFAAASVPLSQLELLLDRLVPRRTAPIVWCDERGDADGLAASAAAVAAANGWTDQRILAGGVEGWAATGGELYRGVNVPSKAFGEHVEHTADTPRITATELRRLQNDGTDLVVLDARTPDEFRRMSIPTATACPGGELVHRIADVAPDPATLVVVNCAGRTRSIIGAQSLINAGVPNRVVALENGTMGWLLADLELDGGREVHAPEPSPDAIAWGRDAAAEVGRRFGVRRLPPDEVDRWLDDPDRTTYLLDVRSPAEFEAGHLPGSRSAPGGQLVQATDEFVAVRNARLVLIDDTEVRATMTASWLRQLGWDDAVVLAGGLAAAADDGTAPVTGRAARPSVPPVPTIRVSALAERLAGTDGASASLAVLDVGTSLKYHRKGHIAGAWWGVRSRLGEARAAIGPVDTLVITSTDGLLAKLAVADARAHWPGTEILALAGGNKGWRHGGNEMEPGLTRPTTEPDDVWYSPYDLDEPERAAAMTDYLRWETGLVEQVDRDPTVEFPTFY